MPVQGALLSWLCHLCSFDGCTEMPVVVQILSYLSHFCLEIPWAAVERFPQQRSKLGVWGGFFDPLRAKKSLPANTAFGPGSEGHCSVVYRPNHFSWKVLCCCLFWNHRCNLFLCSVFWCHQFPGMKSWPRVCKWKISVCFSPSKVSL